MAPASQARALLTALTPSINLRCRRTAGMLPDIGAGDVHHAKKKAENFLEFIMPVRPFLGGKHRVIGSALHGTWNGLEWLSALAR